jgi:hypothetical protein
MNTLCYQSTTNNHMAKDIKAFSRKKILLLVAAVLSSLTVFKFISGKKKNEPVSETVKMLTQDGKLVEIDKKLLASSDKKISNEELKKWVKNKLVNNKTN